MDMGVYSCRYCIKKFCHSKYVLKHMLKRHPEKMQSLQNLLETNHEVGTSKTSATVSKTIAHKIAKIEKLQKMREKLKCDVLQLLEDTAEYQCGLGTGNLCAVESLDPRQKERDVSQHSHIVQLIELQTKCKNITEVVNDLQKKYEHLLEFVKQSVSLKEIVAKNEIDNQSMLKELKKYKSDITTFRDQWERDLASLKSSISCEMQRHNLECMEKLSKCNEAQALEIQNLRYSIESHLTKLNSTKCNDMDEKFEQYLQNYLNRLTRTSNKKCKRKRILPPPKTTVPTTNKLGKFSQESFSFKRVKTEMKRQPNFLDDFHKEVQKLVDSKMQHFGMSCQSRVTSPELLEKTNLLQNEKKCLQSKYPDFNTIHEKLEKLVYAEVHSLLSQGVQAKETAFSSAVSTARQNRRGKILQNSTLLNSFKTPVSHFKHTTQDSFKHAVSNLDAESELYDKGGKFSDVSILSGEKLSNVSILS